MPKLLLSLLILIGLVGCQLTADSKNSPNPVPNTPDATAVSQATLSDAAEHGPQTARQYQYKVRGKRYGVFKSAKNFQQIGSASWYGPGFHGKKTASGERYNMYAMTAAHKTLPLGANVLVTNLKNGKKVTVRINDRGPFHGGRIIDLSKKAAQQLGIIQSGHAKVHVKIIE